MTITYLTRVLRSFVIVGIFFAHLPVSFAQTSATIRVAAAANLNGVIEALIFAYKKPAGHDIKVVYGSSGHFYQQMTQGARYDIFLSANEEFADRLATQGFAEQAPVVYARGRLVVLIAANTTIRLSADLQDLKTAVAQKRLIKFAIANPALAPYGGAALQVLRKMDLLVALQPHLVLGADVGQTMLFIRAQAAQAGIVPLSMVKHSTHIMPQQYVVIPESWHQAIDQKMLMFKNPSEPVRSFYTFLQSPEARLIWQHYGYE